MSQYLYCNVCDDGFIEDSIDADSIVNTGCCVSCAATYDDTDEEGSNE